MFSRVGRGGRIACFGVCQLTTGAQTDGARTSLQRVMAIAADIRGNTGTCEWRPVGLPLVHALKYVQHRTEPIVVASPRVLESDKINDVAI